MSFSWAHFGRKDPEPPASSASAGRTLDAKTPNRQHHELQLGALWTQRPRTASIMSISWAHFGREDPKPPASSASAGRTLDAKTPNRQHHEHQLGALWTQRPRTASIMSFSWAHFGRKDPEPPASSASAGRTLDAKTPNRQHHELQLDALWTQRPRTASIMSISWAHFGRKDPEPPASSASAGRTLDAKTPNRQHHEHQLGALWTQRPRIASIMSISWARFGRKDPELPAS